ncbi:hypothetical protein A2U01_0041617, partial [Trifolium medium]|nr:hypothetical protein [Trifolium medium]
RLTVLVAVSHGRWYSDGVVVVVVGGAEVVMWRWVAHRLRFDGACGRLVVLRLGSSGGWR